MIERYVREEMKKLWSEEHKYQAMLKVEIANCYALMKQGLIDQTSFDRISKASVSVDDVEAIEKETKHDVVAFIKAASKSLGDEKKYFHYGLTSTDVVDTAYALRLKAVNQILIQDIDDFMAVLKEKALAYKNTPVMGRTHGMHAEVMPFGMKFALWYEDFKRIRSHFIKACENIEVVKLSGAVGTYSTSNPGIQHMVAMSLGLQESLIATQTLQRDRHAFYLSQIALLGTELEKIATEIRHLSRTEVFEVSEPFSVNQKGSSAMPHKKNPIASENICGLARMLRGYMHVAYENISLWHERDISHSSTERIMLPDATSLLDYMFNRYKHTINDLVVNETQMKKNIESSNGLYATQKIMNALVDKGWDRLLVHDELQAMSRIVFESDIHLAQVLNHHKDIKNVLTEDEITQLFDYKHAFRFVDVIYHKIF